MISFQIKLAEISMKVYCLYQSTERFCREYLTEEEPCFEIEITQQDIEKERIYSNQNCIQEGHEVIHYSDAYLETLALYRKIAARLLDFHVLLFHGSVIAVHGEAYLFTAKSGTGKTTHTKLWLKNSTVC